MKKTVYLPNIRRYRIWTDLIKSSILIKMMWKYLRNEGNLTFVKNKINIGIP